MPCFLVLKNILIKTIIFAPCPRTTLSLKIQKLQLAELVGYTGSSSSEETNLVWLNAERSFYD